MGLWKKIKKVAKKATKAVGSVFGAVTGTTDTNKLNQQMAREQMDFQADMSNTSYQRSMQDMKTAGLNPILAYKQGGASTPSGASAKMENPVATGMDLFNKTTATALAMKRNSKELKLLDEQIRATKNTGSKAFQDSLVSAFNAKSLKNQNDVFDAMKPYLLTKAKWASEHTKVAEGEAVSDSLRKILGGGGSVLQHLSPLKVPFKR